MIECRGVHTRIGGFALRDVSFSIPAGAHTVLTGPTASGKTTLLELIAGAVTPTAGGIIVCGIDVTSTAPELRNVGMVPQHGYLFPHLNARANIEYGTRDATAVTGLAERFGISHLMDRAVASLSGGERQLVALCRALAPRPAVLLLDEPFSALDGNSREAALHQFSMLQAEQDFTVLHVTHQEIDARFATARLEMANGVVTIAEISAA